MSHTAVDAFLLVYAALFPIVNPLGGAPIFLGLTHTYTPALQQAIAWRVGVGSFALLVGSLLIGSHVLGLFGLTLPVVRIAGGIVVAAMGWRLLNAQDNPVESHAPDHAGAEDRVALQRAFYPITMPLTVGPGSIATAIALGSTRPLGPQPVSGLLAQGIGAIAGLFAISGTVYLCYRYAGHMVRLFGPSGTSIFTRLSAFLLLCIGVQIIWNGFSALIPSLSNAG
ncbi:MAG: putative antibiotic resistance protein [Nevskia sp.]|nr:putative antibiotic resistance protein [Nevskia sp.]